VRYLPPIATLIITSLKNLQLPVSTHSTSYTTIIEHQSLSYHVVSTGPASPLAFFPNLSRHQKLHITKTAFVHKDEENKEKDDNLEF
jgi:hypothetical protein